MYVESRTENTRKVRTMTRKLYGITFVKIIALEYCGVFSFKFEIAAILRRNSDQLLLRKVRKGAREL